MSRKEGRRGLGKEEGEREMSRKEGKGGLGREEGGRRMSRKEKGRSVEEPGSGFELFEGVEKIH